MSADPATADLPAAKRPRGGGSLGDLARTLLVVGVVVGIIYVVASFHTGQPRVRRVDDEVRQTIAQLRTGAAFTVLAPNGLPAAWAPTSVSFDPQPTANGQRVLHIGYVTPSGLYADLEEAGVAVTALLTPYAGRAPKPQGTVSVAGHAAELAVSADQRITMTESIDRTYVGVTGTATQSELTALLASLRS